MNDSGVVRRFERLRDEDPELDALQERERRLLVPGREILPVQPLHREKRLPRLVEPPRCDHAHDPRMIEVPEHIALALQARLFLRVHPGFAPDHLDRHGRARRLVDGPVHHPGATAPDFVLNTEASAESPSRKVEVHAACDSSPRPTRSRARGTPEKPSALRSWRGPPTPGDMTRGTFSWCLLVVVGCGAGKAAPKVPEQPPAAAAPADAPKNPASDESSAPDAESATVPAADATPAPSADTPGPEALSPEDLTKVLQAVLDDPELTSYLHVEKPGRARVKVAGPDLPKDLKLVKGGYEVTIVDGPRSPKDPVVVITRIKVEDKSVSVAYKYDVEGIRGTTRVKNGATGWELASSRIIER